MEIKETMKKEVTVGNLILTLLPVIIIVLTWGNSVETRLTEYSIRITNTERTNAKNEAKLNKIIDNQTEILIRLENKKDRKK